MKYLFWDLETFSAGDEYGMKPEEFVRIMHYAWNDGPVQATTDYEEMLDLVRSADYVIGHNIISADLGWLFGQDSLEPLQMAMARKVIDTFYLANLLKPAPFSYQRKDGSRATATSKPVGHSMSWLGLENLCHQFGLPGKFGSLRDLAKKYNPPGTLVRDLQYGLIPLDDPDFLKYAEQDVIALRGLYHYLLEQIREQEYPGETIWREMELMSATCGQMKRNGILVDQDFANKRVEEMAVRREEILKWLVEEFNFPTEGKSPWASTAGKEAIIKAFKHFGITPETHEWPRTPKGDLKLGGEDLITLAEGTEAEEFAAAIAELKGQRSIPQLVLDSMKEDGRVHPDITALQKSGRWSFTKPGVTVFGERDERLRNDKAIFHASKGKVLVGFDYSAADARAMAALSGDEAYAERFKQDENGEDLYDAHNMTGEAVFGVDKYYGGGPRDKHARPFLRPVAKVVGHASNYSVGAYKLAVTLNQASKKENLGLTFWAPAGNGAKELPRYEDSHLTRDILDNFNKAYPWLKLFKDMAVKEAEEFGYITNTWGRRLYTDPGREYTGAPALYGQGTTAGIMGDAVLRLVQRGEYYIRALRAIIHDELLLEFDEETVERDIAVVKECMEMTFDPKRAISMPIDFPVSYGVGKNWRDAGH